MSPEPGATLRCTEGRFPEREPEGVPDLAEVEVPAGLRREIERAMKRYPEKRSASIPALWAVQRKYGWCSPEGIRQAAAVMGADPRLPRVDRELLRPLPPRAEGLAPGPRLHQHLLLAEGRGRGARRVRGGRGTGNGAGGSAGEAEQPPDVMVTGFECLGACDIAPMASIDERYYGPLEPGDAATAIEQMKSKDEVLPKKALAERGAAGGKTAPADKRLTKHPLGKPKRPRPKNPPKPKVKAMKGETRLLFRNIDEPGLASIRTYKRLGGYDAMKKAYTEMEPEQVLKELEGSGLQGPRRRRLRDGQEGLLPARTATWRSTSAATPTSPSPAPSRTAS